MAKSVDLTLEIRDYRYDVRVANGNESDWDQLDKTLQALHDAGMLLYCGRQMGISNGACRFIPTKRLTLDKKIIGQSPDHQQKVLLGWLQSKVNA